MFVSFASRQCSRFMRMRILFKWFRMMTSHLCKSAQSVAVNFTLQIIQQFVLIASTKFEEKVLKNFLVCDGEFTFDTGGLACTGSLGSVSIEDIRGESSSLTWQQVSEYQDQILLLFALAFGFLVIKKVL